MSASCTVAALLPVWMLQLAALVVLFDLFRFPQTAKETSGCRGEAPEVTLTWVRGTAARRLDLVVCGGCAMVGEYTVGVRTL